MVWCVFHYGVVCIPLWCGVYSTMVWCVFHYGICLFKAGVEPFLLP